MMRRLLLLSLFASSAAWAQAPVTSLTVVSDPRDRLVRGGNFSIGSDTTFEVSASTQAGDWDLGFIQSARVEVKSPGGWTLSFAANNGVLKPGFYDHLQRLSNGPGKPAMDVAYNHSGCDDQGSFAVLDAHVDYSVQPAKLTRFAVAFDAQCGTDPYGLAGILYWNYVPTSTLAITSSEMRYGDAATATVTLADPAPAGGASVELQVSDRDLVSIAQPRVTIPAGQRTATFPITIAGAPFGDERVRFLANYNGVASEAEIVVRAPSRQITRIEMVSDLGDFVGEGQTIKYEASDGLWDWFGLSATRIELRYYGSSSHWSFVFKAPPDKTFPGVFPNAKRASSSESSPGLDVEGSYRNPSIGNGCNTLTGFFSITQADIDYSYNPPKLLRFAGEFEQHCEGAKPALHGHIFYNYDPPSRVRLVKK